jgi:hypothetical protein
MRERYAFFSEKTVRYWKEWMAVRDPQCTHDHILHSKRLRLCNPHELSREFAAQSKAIQVGGRGSRVALRNAGLRCREKPYFRIEDLLGIYA